MVHDKLIVKAPAKINLFLQVTGRRPDGYHTLRTLMQKVALFDELTLEWCDDAGIRLDCHGSGLPAGEDNIAHRAAAAFLEAARSRLDMAIRGISITLKKGIPIAAGLGGGSSDAAGVLTALNRLYGQPFSAAELAEIGLRLGADVPFFLAEASACVAEGIGEKLTPVTPLDGYAVLLVNPGFPVSTQWVYQTFALTRDGDLGSFKNFQNAEGAQGTAAAPGMHRAANDLEAVTFSRYPVVAQIKADLLDRGADSALMSGSGPTVFGLFQERESAEAALIFFREQYEQTYLTAGIT